MNGKKDTNRENSDTSVEKQAFSEEDKAVYPNLPGWGFASVCIAVILFSWNVQSLIPGIILAALLLLSLVFRRRFRISRSLQFILLFVLTSVFILIHSQKPIPVTYNVVPELYPVFYYTAAAVYFVMLIGVYKLKTRMDLYVIHLCTLIIIFIGSLFAPYSLKPVSIILFCLYGVSTAFYYLQLLTISYPVNRPQKNAKLRYPVSQLFSIALIVAASVLVGGLLEKNESKIFMAIFNKLKGTQIFSFSNSTTLGRMDEMFQSDRVVMRVVSESPPMTLKGKMYNKYSSGKWTVKSKKGNLPTIDLKTLKVAGTGILSNNYPVFVLDPGNPKAVIKSNELEIVDVTSFFARNNIIFVPQKAAAVSLNSLYLQCDQLGNVLIPLKPVNHYTLLTFTRSQEKYHPVRDKILPEDTEIPPEIAPKIREITLGVTGNRKTVPGKVLAIIEYLQENFTYHRGIKLEHRDMDPVLEFLVYKRQAHCEYFASAMALMLRSIKVPARYTVGFIAHEYNKVGSYYLVREKDAHAWVTAYIPGRGWTSFDPTPPVERPGRGTRTDTTDWFGYLKTKFEAIKQYFKNGEYKKIIGELIAFVKTILKSPYPWYILAAVVIIPGIYFLRKMWTKIFLGQKKKKTEVTSTGEPLIIKQVKQRMNEFDQFLRKKEVERPPNLTLTEFSNQLGEDRFSEKLGDRLLVYREFLQTYHRMRYGKMEDEIDKEDLKELDDLLKIIRE